MKFAITALLGLCLPCISVAQNTPSAVKTETLSQSSSAWDGTPYKAYPSGRPQLTVVKITIAPHTELKWHSHPMPNAGYILSGKLTVEKKDGARRTFVAGQAIDETVNVLHRGVTGSEPVVLIVFYAGTPGMPLSK